MVTLKKNYIYLTPEGIWDQVGKKNNSFNNYSRFDLKLCQRVILDGYTCEVNHKKLNKFNSFKGIYLLLKLKINHRKLHNDWRQYCIYTLDQQHYLSTYIIKEEVVTSAQLGGYLRYSHSLLITEYQNVLDDLKANLIVKTGIMISPYFNQGWRIICYQDHQIYFIKYIKNLSNDPDHLINETRLYLCNRFGITINDIDVLKEGSDFKINIRPNLDLKFLFKRMFNQIMLRPKKQYLPLNIKLKSSHFLILIFYLLSLVIILQLIQVSYYGLHLYRLNQQITKQYSLVNLNLKKILLKYSLSSNQIFTRLFNFSRAESWHTRLDQLSRVTHNSITIREMVWQKQVKESLQLRFRPFNEWDENLTSVQWRHYYDQVKKIWPGLTQANSVTQSIKVTFNDS